MAAASTPRTSLFVIPALKAPVAAIFRRGPSRQVRLIKWNLKDDSFERGQWFKGRIYERRCDLSPDGELLVYFAAKQRPPHGTWTAISRPPYLTALAFWPKGDTWGGGGYFKTDRKVLLDLHCEDPGGKVPLRIAPFDLATGMNKERRVWGARLARDGWREIPGDPKDYDKDLRVTFDFNPPLTFAKPSPAPCFPGELQMLIKGINEKGGAWYVIEYRLMRDGGTVLDLGRSGWADWDRKGDLLCAKGGKLYRLKPDKKAESPYDFGRAREIADFTAERFEEIAPEPQALQWPARKKRNKR